MSNIHVALVRLIVLGLTPALFLTGAGPEFDVATVKQSPPPEGDTIQINIGGLRNGRLSFTNASLSDCLKFAYGIVSDAQLIGPDWIKSKDVRFDIVALIPPNTSRDQINLMLQNLLAGRLKTAVHHEQRQLPYLALIVGKNGSKLRETSAQPDNNSAMRGRIASHSMPTLTLATLLSRFERETVVDMTNLKGNFEFKLEWTPDNGIKPDDSGPSLFAAVQEQLGLRLESRKGPLDVLVVDHAEKIPVDN